MKRYIYRFFALLTTVLGAWTFTGCADDVDTYTTEESGCFNLVVTVPDESATRADEYTPTAEEIGLNEFKVTKLHLYFYKSTDAAGASVYDYVWTGEFNTTQKLTVPLPADALLDGGLFGATGTECIVYAVANVDEDTLPDGPQTIAGLKALGITSTFNETVTQPSFAMDGQKTVTMDRTARRATGEITLQRAAAKITLAVNVAAITVPGETETGITYTPNTVSMHVWIGNGVKNSKLNIAADDITANDLDGALYSNKITTGEGNHGTGFNDKGAEPYKYVQNVPFYSYPNKWESTSPDGNCYLTLVLPWTYTDAAGNEQPITTYYRVPVQLKECVIERNMHYDIRVTIGRLGSTDPQEPIDVDVEWNYAIPWNTHGENVDIKQVRYLLLNNNNFNDALGAYTFDMDNTTSIEIPVGTSHDVKIASVTMSWNDYSKNPVTKHSITLTPNGDNKYSNLAGYNESTQTSIFAGIEMNNTTSKLMLKRYMLHLQGGPVWVEEHEEWQRVNGHWQEVTIPAHWDYSDPLEITKEDALNTYTFDIKLQHADDDSQTAMVRITQYPAIYITAQETASSNHRFVNGKNSGDLSGGLGSIGSDDNHNTYIITISRFESENYVIADPRSRSIDNGLSSNNSSDASWSYSGTPKDEGSQRRLSYYYPADPSGDKTNYIAPKFRIASQYGVTLPIDLQGARRRCASYQENGRPAGRWRLPTIAEITYIATLSCNGYIPYLFGTASNTSRNTANYWCASGAVAIANNANNPTVEPSTDDIDRWARCVYDEWYWGNDTLTVKNQFRWGDRLRTTSGN